MQRRQMLEKPRRHLPELGQIGQYDPVNSTGVIMLTFMLQNPLRSQTSYALRCISSMIIGIACNEDRSAHPYSTVDSSSCSSSMLHDNHGAHALSIH